MTGVALRSILSVAVALASGAGVPAAVQEHPRFRSSVDLVSVTAVVRDRKGRFVEDLSRQDFEILDGGQSRPILDFRSERDGPVRLAVLLDISGSMKMGQRALDARKVAGHIFASLGPEDLAAVYTFDTALTQAQAFTSSQEALLNALEDVEPPYGQTSLYDAIAETARAVAAAAISGGPGALQRSAVAVLTDGVDTRSRLTSGEVSMAASGIDVPVYIVAVAAGVDDPRETGRRAQAERAGDLEQLARSTGGDLFIASAPAHASQAARQMVSELRHQYFLAFEASNRPGWRPLEVRTRRSSLVVRARTGYSGGSALPEQTSSGRLISGPAMSGGCRTCTGRRQS